MLVWETIGDLRLGKQCGEQPVFVQRQARSTESAVSITTIIVGLVMLLDHLSEPPLSGVTPRYTVVFSKWVFS